MGRRRKYKKRKKGPFAELDWSVDPDTIREIGSVVLFIVGALFTLSIFGAAGKVGVAISKNLDYLFGVLGYLIPFILLLLGYMLWNPKRFDIKASSWIGAILILIFFPALISPAGGIVGLRVAGLIKGLIGTLASFVMLLGVSIIGFLLLFNTSIKKLYSYFVGPEEEKAQTKISVFTALKNKLTGRGFKNNVNVADTPSEAQSSTGAVVAKTSDTNWRFPPLDLLALSDSKATSGNIAKNVDIIKKNLEDFGIEVTMGDVNIGPTVTQYTLKPIEGVKLSQIEARQKDLALALAAHPIRIEAPIPGKSAVGIEIPNKVTALVTLREILESEEFKKSKSHLSIALGRDVAGKPIVIDLARMPHFLIAGATGSGKSICINGIIDSFLYQNSPSDLRFILIDPKRVEFTHYNNIPHLLTPVVTEPDKIVNSLKWAVDEMERRYKLLSEHGSRDIVSYNQKPGPAGKLPYIVILIDELADLMMKSAKEVEIAIVRIAQMARAVGMHLVIATQRPSVNVITGLIKANIASRIAFAVASQVDSRTILDQSGAEKLLGKGDMLYISPEFGKPKRVQGVMVNEREVRQVTGFLKKEATPQYDESIIEYKSKSGVGGVKEGEIDDDMYEEAKELVITSQKASASYLQRRLRVGYARAARLLDLLESQGIVGPAEGAKPRKVLAGPGEGSSNFSPDDSRLDEE